MWVSACSFRQYLEQHTITRHGNQIHVVCQLSECPSQWWIWLMYLVLEINIVMSSSLFMLITYYSVVTGQERLVLTIECVKPVWTDQITQTTTKTQAGCIQNCLHLRRTMWWAAWFRIILQPLYSHTISVQSVEIHAWVGIQVITNNLMYWSMSSEQPWTLSGLSNPAWRSCTKLGKEMMKETAWGSWDPQSRVSLASDIEINKWWDWRRHTWEQRRDWEQGQLCYWDK